MKKRDIVTITLLWLTVLLVALKLFYFPGLNWGWVFAPFGFRVPLVSSHFSRWSCFSQSSNTRKNECT